MGKGKFAGNSANVFCNATGPPVEAPIKSALGRVFNRTAEDELRAEGARGAACLEAGAAGVLADGLGAALSTTGGGTGADGTGAGSGFDERRAMAVTLS